MLKNAGYQTACIGKWHVGEEPKQMPLEQGFDYFFGTPKYTGNSKLIKQSPHRSQVLRNNDTLMVIQSVKEMGQLTGMYTREAVNFIKKNKDNPFFLYLSHNMPHVPVGASERLRGISEGGFYGDVIEEGKTNGELLTTKDFLPNFSKIANAKLPEDLNIDGKSFIDVILNNDKSQHDRFYYYAYTQLQAVRNNEWKLVLPRPKKPGYMKWKGRKIDAVDNVQLYNLIDDKEEKHNLTDQYPEKVKELIQLIEEGRKELGDNNRIREGARFFDDDSKTERIDEYSVWLNNTLLESVN